MGVEGDVVKLTMTIKEINEIHEAAIMQHLASAGFSPHKPILRLDEEGPFGEVESIFFEQDDGKGTNEGDLECEYLESLSSLTTEGAGK